MDQYKAPPWTDQSLGVVKLRGTRADPYDAPAPSWLEKLGITRIYHPAIRQSTILDWFRCPRLFLLRHRLGLRPKRVPRAKSLDVGHFFHRIMQYRTITGKTEPGVVACGREIDDIITKLPVSDDLLSVDQDPSLLQADMERSLQLARVMATIFDEMNPQPEGPSVIETEVEIGTRLRGMRVDLEGTLDALDVGPEGIWIDEYKTCGGQETPLDRIATVTFEPQVLLYRVLAAAWAKANKITVPIVGVRHHVVQKPQIQFGRNDRSFQIIKKILKSGPRKGLEVEEKIYDEGPPLFENYLRRVRDWYQGTGDYSDSKELILSDPRMVRCHTRFSGPLLSSETTTVLHEVHRASTAKPSLPRFYKNCLGCHRYGRTCPYLKLCQTDPVGWRPLLESEYENSKACDESGLEEGVEDPGEGSRDVAGLPRPSER